jgi:hypothetical protein
VQYQPQLNREVRQRVHRVDVSEVGGSLLVQGFRG